MSSSPSFRLTASRVASGSVLAVLLLLTPAAADAQQDWPLRCNLRTAQIRFSAHSFLMYFRPATAGTQTRQPAPGECAWADRGFGEDEPNQVYFQTEGEYAVLIDGDNQFMSVIAYNSRPPQAEVAAMDLFAQQWRTGGMITFYVRNTGRSMTVTRIAR